ncbi:hypothetical protein PILCRDRAFT_4185 [Piloderma croceum F 1598]|uniref:Uncharacterized protein n=1 Tax=Piloderma croceum (strain F 1598) TaxID=765440 RepID=A0A0C3CB50_PILCF|nr:hypothetical protein PILCRDRAFT_4185 [Piloderma croceum F 1598]
MISARIWSAQILSLLCNVQPKLPIRFKLFVSLRPEHNLQTSLLHQGTYWGSKSYILHDVDASVVRGGIKRFLHSRLTKVAADYSKVIGPGPWPSPEDISALAEKSDKLFIFAATVVKFVADTDNPKSQLDLQVLEQVLSATANEMVIE